MGNSESLIDNDEQMNVHQITDLHDEINKKHKGLIEESEEKHKGLIEESEEKHKGLIEESEEKSEMLENTINQIMAPFKTAKSRYHYNSELGDPTHTFIGTVSAYDDEFFDIKVEFYGDGSLFRDQDQIFKLIKDFYDPLQNCKLPNVALKNNSLDAKINGTFITHEFNSVFVLHVTRSINPPIYYYRKCNLLNVVSTKDFIFNLDESRNVYVTIEFHNGDSLANHRAQIEKCIIEHFSGCSTGLLIDHRYNSIFTIYGRLIG